MFSSSYLPYNAEKEVRSSIMYYMNLPDIIHASESSCLFIRIIVDSLKQHRGVSWGICFSCSTSPPICLCLLCSVICPSVHSYPPHIHPTAHSISHGPFCPLISFDTSVLIFIHVIGLVSVNPSGALKTWIHLVIAGVTFLLHFPHTARWHQTGHDP